MDKNNATTEPTPVQSSINNTDSSSLRFHAEVYLKEYEIVRREMEYRFSAQESSFSYLISLVVGLLAILQIFGDSSSIIQTLYVPPFLYLITAAILMFFPISYVYHNTTIVLLGLYQYEVLAEKFDWMSSELAEHDESTRRFLEWQEDRFRGTPYSGTLRWDYFRLYNQAGSATATLMMAPLTIFRPLILLITPVILLVLFLQTKPLSDIGTWTAVDFVGMAVLLFSIVVFLYGGWYVTRAQLRAKAIMEALINNSLTDQFQHRDLAE